MDNTIKILEVMGEGIAHGGEEAFINNLVLNINMDGLTIDWLTPYKCYNTLYENNLKKMGGKVYELGLSYTPGKNRWHLTKPLNDFFAEHQYDVVHIHSGSISALALISGAAYRHGVKKIIVHSHLGSNGSMKSKLIRTAYSPYLQKFPTTYLACSREAAEAKFAKKILDSKVQLINNGIDLSKYRQNDEIRENIRKDLGIPQDSRVIGHVGRFSPEKNHQHILRCFEQVLQKESNSYLMLLGDGELHDDIKQMAKDMSIEDHVRFVGYVDNVSDYYKAMDLFILPSFYEGFSIALIEAQATGLPCFISDQMDAKSAIYPNVYKLSIGEGSETVWANTICEHLFDESIHDQTLLTQKGFDIKETARQIRAIYMEK